MATHRVEPGQKLSEIAASYGVSTSDLVAANPRRSAMRLSSGEVVFRTLAAGEDIDLPQGARFLGAPGNKAAQIQAFFASHPGAQYMAIFQGATATPIALVFEPSCVSGYRILHGNCLSGTSGTALIAKPNYTDFVTYVFTKDGRLVPVPVGVPTAGSKCPPGTQAIGNKCGPIAHGKQIAGAPRSGPPGALQGVSALGAPNRIAADGTLSWQVGQRMMQASARHDSSCRSGFRLTKSNSCFLARVGTSVTYRSLKGVTTKYVMRANGQLGVVSAPANQVRMTQANHLAPVVYQVKRGDTTSSIARDAGTTVAALLAVNAKRTRFMRNGQWEFASLPEGTRIKLPIRALKAPARTLSGFGDSCDDSNPCSDGSACVLGYCTGIGGGSSTDSTSSTSTPSCDPASCGAGYICDPTGLTSMCFPDPSAITTAITGGSTDTTTSGGSTGTDGCPPKSSACNSNSDCCAGDLCVGGVCGGDYMCANSGGTWGNGTCTCPSGTTLMVNGACMTPTATGATGNCWNGQPTDANGNCPPMPAGGVNGYIPPGGGKTGGAAPPPPKTSTPAPDGTDALSGDSSMMTTALIVAGVVGAAAVLGGGTWMYLRHKKAEGTLVEKGPKGAKKLEEKKPKKGLHAHAA